MRDKFRTLTSSILFSNYILNRITLHDPRDGEDGREPIVSIVQKFRTTFYTEFGLSVSYLFHIIRNVYPPSVCV